MDIRKLLGLACLLCQPAWGDNPVLQLPLGDQDRREQWVSMSIDSILDTSSGTELSPQQLAQSLEGTRIVLAGEEHTNMEFHRVQLALIKALHDAGREVIIGLEMFPYEDQGVLDNWVAGHFTEAGFVDQSNWYQRWGYHWGYYRDIFFYAREHGLAMRGLNAPREVISRFRKEGRDALSPDQAKHLPEQIDVDSDDHMRLFKAYFDSDDPIHASLTEAQWKGMFSAQAAWDAVMGFNAMTAVQDKDDNAIIVVLVGAGHAVYGLGIERQVANWSPLGVSAVIPVPVGETDTRVRAGYGNFLWGIPAEVGPRFPVLGTATITTKGRVSVIDLEDSSVAKKLGVSVGDKLVALDEQKIDDRSTLNRLMADYSWGDHISLTVERDGELKTFTGPLRRYPRAAQP